MCLRTGGAGACLIAIWCRAGPHDMHDAEQEPSSICGLKGSRRYGQSQRELYEGRTGEGDYEARSGEAASYNRGNYEANFAGVPQGTLCPMLF